MCKQSIVSLFIKDRRALLQKLLSCPPAHIGDLVSVWAPSHGAAQSQHEFETLRALTVYGLLTSGGGWICSHITYHI